MIKQFLNSSSISARGVLKACEIPPQKWYNVKRGMSSFTPEEKDKIFEQIYTLKNFPVIPKREFLDFLRDDKRIILKHVLPSLSENQYEQFRKDLNGKGVEITDKRLGQVVIAFAKWQATLPDVKEYLIKEEIDFLLSIKPHTIEDFNAVIEANFTEREVEFYKIEPDDIESVLYHMKEA